MSNLDEQRRKRPGDRRRIDQIKEEMDKAVIAYCNRCGIPHGDGCLRK